MNKFEYAVSDSGPKHPVHIYERESGAVVATIHHMATHEQTIQQAQIFAIAYEALALLIEIGNTLKKNSIIPARDQVVSAKIREIVKKGYGVE